MTTRTSRIWVLYLAAVAAVTAAYVAGPLDAGPVFNIVGASAVVAILVGVRRNRPASRLPWYCFAFGQATFVAGDILAYNYTKLFGAELPFPSIADAAYLCVFPSLITGLVLLIRRRSPGRDRDSLIDALIVTVGVGALAWTMLMAPLAAASDMSLAARITSMLYPLGDLLLMGVVVRLAVGAGKRPATLNLLAYGVAALLVTDAVYGYLQLHGLYEGTGNLLDGGWMLFYALLGAAALHPSMVRVSDPDPEPETRLTARRMGLLAAAMLLAPSTLVIQAAVDGAGDALALAGASIALSGLVLARMSGIVRRHEAAARREGALRRAGEVLSSADDTAVMDNAVVAAAREVAGVACEARIYLMETTGSRLIAEAASEIDAARLAPVERSAIPPRLAKLLGLPGTVVDGASGDGDGLFWSSRRDGRGSAVLAPVLVREELRGVLVVWGSATPSAAAREGLASLAAQVALRLESVALMEDLVSREARFSSLVTHASDVITVVDPDTTIRYLSESVDRVLGLSHGELLGSRFVDLVHPDDAPRVVPFLANLPGDVAAPPDSVQFRIQRRDGGWIDAETVRVDLLDNPHVAGIVLTTRDVSERKAFEAQLAHQAFHDPVTQLPNRALFGDRVERAVARQLRHQSPLAVLFLDLDDFKTVNDSLGHAAGDTLLREVGERLQQCVRSVDTAARLGGDEFAILLEDIEGEQHCVDVATRILESLSAPIVLEGRSVTIHASIGIAIGDTATWTEGGAETLLRNADVAMYAAKAHGKNCFTLFEPGMQSAAENRLNLKADLQQAMREDQFFLLYQPIVELATGELTGVEALVRWQHPERGLVAPDEFIPLTEETGLIIPLGRRILMAACAEARRLQSSERSANLTMSVNVSVRQLRSPSFTQDVRDALESSGIPPATLVLELTESMMMSNTEDAVERLNELRALGVKVAIDDFGTGYSSLSYIRNLPIDMLKVDRSFIRDLTQGGEQSALVEAILDLAGVMKLSAVAEGIEDSDQLSRLQHLNCDLGQGYHFHRPMTSEAVEELALGQAAEGQPAPGTRIPASG